MRAECGGKSDHGSKAVGQRGMSEHGGKTQDSNEAKCSGKIECGNWLNDGITSQIKECRCY